MSIGRLFHVLHAADELDPLDAFYDRLFAPWHGMMERHHSERERRMGSILVIADAAVETAAPSADPGAQDAPIGRFVAKFGRHWHSLAWYCDDVGEVWERLTAAGVRVFEPGAVPAASRPAEGDIYTHPKDTATQLEFYQPPASHGGPQGSGPFPDPRFGDDWPARWAQTGDPLGVERLAWVTLVVGDLDRAVAVFCDGVGGRVVHEAESAVARTRGVFVAVGPSTVVELATPLRPGSLAGRDLAAFGDTLHAVAFTVADLDRVSAHLGALGIGVAARDDTTILADPADTFGAAFRFTTGRVPGDPRD